MTAEPERIQTDIAALLAEVPEIGMDDGKNLDLDDIATRLEQAHDALVQALESVEKG